MINAFELEGYLVKEDQHQNAPAEAIKIYNEGVAEGVPTGIAKHPRFGWFVIQTSGQGPYVIWEEPETCQRCDKVFEESDGYLRCPKCGCVKKPIDDVIPL